LQAYVQEPPTFSEKGKQTLYYDVNVRNLSN